MRPATAILETQSDLDFVGEAGGGALSAAAAAALIISGRTFGDQLRAVEDSYRDSSLQ